MYRLNILLMVLFLVMNAPEVHSKMYKWVDENGGIHWTDNPPPPETKADVLKEYETVEDKKPATYYRNRSYSTPTSKPKDRRKRRITISKNPIAEVSRSNAEKDLKLSLLKKYGSHYSTIRMLLDAGMESYDYLCRLPDTPVNNEILSNLKNRYYPHFSTIKMLYESNKKSYNELNR